MNENEKDKQESSSGGSFIWWFIPLILGLSAIVWLMFFTDAHTFSRRLSWENRSASAVGATGPMDSPIKIEIIDKGHCVKLTRVELDGETLAMYSENKCKHEVDFVTWRWVGLSPDGTAIWGGYTNGGICAIPSQPGMKAECLEKTIQEDKRTQTVRIWIDSVN